MLDEMFLLNALKPNIWGTKGKCFRWIPLTKDSIYLMQNCLKGAHTLYMKHFNLQYVVL